ncbi:sulfatase-like hydrolase/transferase [Diaphorobacter sp. HDW4B]|uniref:LTA synthase family protein n=1 Tax=Diaphorobacter sp. HDW4B TaxID=2714925 RepID=UPI00140E8C20|nr:sulfatase-like hydrolase/transferase [Diaphorobacter sp. HDW4B]QIL70278.1 sulfatase-like hydrolase/transferase [Diaphorobacter sp. HDW4B]
MKKFLRWTAVFALAFFGLMAMRHHLTALAVASASACLDDACQTWHTFLLDAVLLGCMLGMIAVCALLPKLLRIPLVLLTCIFVLLFSVDLFVFQFLNMRLNFADVLKYSGDVKVSKTVIAPKVFSVFSVLLVTLTIVACVALCKAVMNAVRDRQLGVVSLAALALIGVHWLPLQVNYISRNVYDDFVTNNLPDGVDKPYSQEEKARLSQIPPPAKTCSREPQAPRPVILLVMESLSLYQSKLLSGVGNNTPELDRIAKRYGYLQRFYANGFTTDGGMISLLVGRPPLPSVNRYSSMSVYEGYTTPEQDFYARLAHKNIPSLYFTGATLEFLDTGKWLQKLNFKQLNGPTDPFYNNLPRGPFDDPGDKAFYRRFLHWYDQERAPGPFFMVMKTTTTHPPFMVPGTDQQGEDAAFRYADEAVGEFVRGLEERNYFDNGLMIIMGDHRSMTVERSGEAKAVGADFMARIPGIVLGREFRDTGEIYGQWQQTDLIPSALSALGMTSCTSDFQGRFFGPAVQPKFILHADGADRDLVMVKIKGANDPSYVQLEGGETNWVDAGDDTPDNAPVVDFITRQRVALPEVDANLTKTILQLRGYLK